jgi:tRNA U38,U39,U40 pseudouridine synthase TruA
MSIHQASQFCRYKVGVQYVGTLYSGCAFNNESRLPCVSATLETSMDRFCKGDWTNLRFSSR